MVLACTPAMPARSIQERIAATLLPSAVRLFGTGALGTLAAHTPGVGHPGTLGGQTMRMLIAQSDRYRVADAARALLNFDSRPWLHTITCPTLVLAAERDSIVPAYHAMVLSQRLPQAVLHTFPAAGHWMLTTHPEAFLDTLLPWISEGQQGIS
jgi:pimeloyl-ACP methyl ester carboxylesterase